MSAPITETTLQAIRDNVLARNEIYRKFAQKYQKTTWDEVAYKVKTGKAHLIYNIGDELICNYRHYESNDVDFTDYEFPWVVAGFRDVEWEDGTIHPGMILQAKHCTIESVQFDAPEREACDPDTETAAEDGIYYFGKSGSTYTALVHMKTISLTTDKKTIFMKTSTKMTSTTSQSFRTATTITRCPRSASGSIRAAAEGSGGRHSILAIRRRISLTLSEDSLTGLIAS